jgi:hypothetical protein
MVRGRVKGDLEHFFPRAKVIETPDADYHYRTTLLREAVADRIRKAVADIHYRDGFKLSVDKRRVQTYFRIWDEMYLLQQQLAIFHSGLWPE